MTALLAFTLLTPAQPPNQQEQAKNAVVMVTTLPNRQAPGFLGVRTTDGKPVDLTPNPVRNRKDLGTGILLDTGDKDHLFVVTAGHVITAADDIWVTALDSKLGYRMVQCPLVHLDRGRDLAVLAIAREAPLQARAVKLQQLEIDLKKVKMISEQPPEKRTIVAIGHPQGDGNIGGGLSWSVNSGHLTAVRSFATAAATIMSQGDIDALDSGIKQRDCIQIDVTADRGMSGGPVYLGDFSKVIGLVWMGTRSAGSQRIVICIPAGWVNEIPFNNPKDWRRPNGFPAPGKAPLLGAAPAVAPPAPGIRSFIVLPIPKGSAIECYLDDDYLMSKFNAQTLDRVLKDRKWSDITHNPTGFGLVAPTDYILAEQVRKVQFFNEPAAQSVLELTATGKDKGRVSVHIYDRDKTVKGNAYQQLISEVVRYRRGLLQLGLLEAPNNDDGFLAKGAREYAVFGPRARVDNQEYVVGSNDIRMFRLYYHVNNQKMLTGEATLSVIGIRRDKVVAVSTTFTATDWNANAPLGFATRFFILGTYSFLD